MQEAPKTGTSLSRKTDSRSAREKKYDLTSIQMERRGAARGMLCQLPQWPALNFRTAAMPVTYSQTTADFVTKIWSMQCTVTIPDTYVCGINETLPQILWNGVERLLVLGACLLKNHRSLCQLLKVARCHSLLLVLIWPWSSFLNGNQQQLYGFTSYNAAAVVVVVAI